MHNPPPHRLNLYRRPAAAAVSQLPWTGYALLLVIPLVALLLTAAVGLGRKSFSKPDILVVGRLGVRPGQFSYPRVVTTDANSFYIIDKIGRVQRFDHEGKLLAHWMMPQVEAGKPVGATVHPDGRLFIADTHYHRVLITDKEGVTLGSFGSMGTGPGEFSLPTDVAVDRDGYLYVSEYYQTDRVSKWTAEGEFLQLIGAEPIDGKQMARPSAMVIDADQTLWVADACNHRLIRFTLDGEVLDIVGSFGSEPGQMKYPYDVNLSPRGELVVCEYGGNRVQWFDRDGNSLRIWGESGRSPGQLFAPWGASYGPGGKLYVVDSLNNRVQIVEP